ncbi:hypothetical protein U15A_A00081 (plasmid) [Escherichia coli]|jgi:hypothetical protein|nr:hypothetical protein U15A_A00081 [Escherichia coli]WEG96328.1 hypothetical protein LFPDFDIP_00062 [Escherichia coli]WKV19914.1 hypothetical protein [Vibrio parahaemolyticus]GDU68471.1 hypothetical protein ExPUPEC61_04198 [Escherichia coli]
MQNAKCGKRNADRGRVPVKAILAENDPKRGRHLSDKLHDEEDRHQGGDDGHAPGPPERSERVESLPA